jgi:hypothetical protein
MSLTSFDIAELNPGQTLEISTASGTHYWLTRVETTRQPDSRHVHGLSVVSNNSRDVVLHICNGSPAECYVKRLIKVGEHLMIGRISAAGGFSNVSTSNIAQITLLGS